MPSVLAVGLVFAASASVLSLEILAARLLAPYVGVTLETYSGVIATVLAGISVGAWIGGRLADRWHPRRLIGPAVAVGGVFTLLAVPAIQFSGQRMSGSRMTVTIGLALVGFFGPALALSTVTPLVIKLQLHDLNQTGRVAGRLSAVSTAGAIFGTLITGYVFIAAVPIRLTLVLLGIALVGVGFVLWVWVGRRARAVALVTVCVAVLGLSAVAGTSPQCDRETKYYCARLEPAGPAGRALLLDDLVHSYVDTVDPHNVTGYVQTFGAVVDALYEPRSPIAALHVGGGGFAFPRYIAATRPGSRNDVIEVDPGVTRLGREELALRTDERLTVTTADGRLGVRTAAARRYDLVVGDAFAGLAVPWHLTTIEFIEDVRRTLKPRGVYVLNVLDYPPLGFLRAEVGSLREVFRHVALVGSAEKLERSSGGNFVAVASDASLDVFGLDQAIRSRQPTQRVSSGASLRGFVGDSRSLTDDFAPVDQLLSPPDDVS